VAVAENVSVAGYVALLLLCGSVKVSAVALNDRIANQAVRVIRPHPYLRSWTFDGPLAKFVKEHLFWQAIEVHYVSPVGPKDQQNDLVR